MAKGIKAKGQGVIPAGEQFSYYFGSFGQGMMYAVMSSYIADYYLNVAGLGPIFVFFLMLLARVWDAVNDPLMGIFMDHAQPKRGKMRPYLYIFPIPVALMTVLLFQVPNTTPGLKMVFSAVVYTLWGMIYTAADIPFWSLPNAMTPKEGERGQLISLARLFNSVGAALPIALMMLLTAVVSGGNEGDRQKYTILALMAAVLGGAGYIQSAFFVRERVPLPKAQKRDKNDGSPGALKLVFTCKPLMLTVIMGILAGGRYMFQAGAIHVARYSVLLNAGVGMTEDDLKASNAKVQLIFQVTLAVGMMLSMVAVPFLIKKFSYKTLVIASCAIGGASALSMYFVGYENIYALIPFLALCGLPVGVLNIVTFAMIGDSLDYMEWQTGKRQNGLGQACNGFQLKLGNALATSAIVLTYFVVKLDLNAVTSAKTTVNPLLLENAAQVRGGIFMLVSLIPAVSFLVCIIPMLFYHLTGDNKRRVMEELAERRALEAAAQ
ncbi:MAG: glycoside-pentoside-hexuronide (GPH):cation symporter [Oscillospiraceae bacterium]|jgi:sugar (glycoside-pentoside-hexuronide) transporter|nr:glycoside-pentoside-hexuronide (GPH):cation symporter [Oscillospiraceae bacterium]